MSQSVLEGAENAAGEVKKDLERISQIRDSKLELSRSGFIVQKERSTSRMKMRKSSIGISQIQGIKPVERTSNVGVEFKRPILTYLPTYQLDPSVRFNATKATKVIEETLDEMFTGHIYNDHAHYDTTYEYNKEGPIHFGYLSQESVLVLDSLMADSNTYMMSPALAVAIASSLVRRLKGLQFNRYRLLALVTIGQRRSQSYNDCVTFLWDSERDAYAESHRQVTTAFVQVVVFGIYLD